MVSMSAYEVWLMLLRQLRTPSLSLPPPPAPLGRAFWPVPDAWGTVTWPSMTDLMYSALSRYSLNCATSVKLRSA